MRIPRIAWTSKGYLNVYLALDNSESMNIPNTDADIQKFIDLLYDDLGGNTWAGRGCTFACHGGSQTAAGDRSYYQFARDNDIVLRQDFVRQEVTDDLDEVKTALASLSGASNYTDIHRSVADIRHAIGDGGDGSADNPAKILVLVTDGVQNKWETEHGTINADDCTTIKEAAGIQVVVLHLIYPDLEHYFPGLGVNQKVIPYTQDRFEQLEVCATPGMYFEANKGQSITEAFREIAEAIVERTPRLMQ